MSEPLYFGFGKLVPGFDFLKTLAQGAAQSAPQAPNMGTWVAPTLDTEELDKRVAELKTVQFWLEQNANAIKATIQALEVQKMTLSALKGMNVSMGDMAEAFKIKTPSFAKPDETAKPAKTTTPGQGEPPGAAVPPVVDPMQWWGALTDQFQQIASTAMKDVSAAAAHQSSSATKPPAKKAASKKPAPRKTARKTSARTSKR